MTDTVIIILSIVILVSAFAAATLYAGHAWALRRKTHIEGIDVLNGLWETFARQSVRYAEEDARKTKDEVGRAPADVIKRNLANDSLVELCRLNGVPAPTGLQLDVLIEGSLAAERVLMTPSPGGWLDDAISPMTKEEFDKAVQLDPSIYRPGDDEMLAHFSIAEDGTGTQHREVERERGTEDGG
jgi:hypothetical protein